MLKALFLLLTLFVNLSHSLEEIWSLEEEFADWKDRVCEAEKIPILGLLPSRTRSRKEFKHFREFKKELEKSGENLFEFAWTADDVQYEWFRNTVTTFVLYVDYDVKNGSLISCEKSRSHFVYSHDMNPVLMAGWVKLYAFPNVIEMNSYEKHTQMILHVKVPKLWIFRRKGFSYPDHFLDLAKHHRGNILVISTQVRPPREGERDPIDWQPGGWGLELEMIVARFTYGGYIDDRTNIAQWIDASMGAIVEVMSEGRSLGLEGTSRWNEFLSVETHKKAVEVSAKYHIDKEDSHEEVIDLSEDFLDPEVPHDVYMRERDEL